MSRYDVNSANTNRIVRFLVQAAHVDALNNATFGMFKGRANSYPHYGQLTTTPTANQELAQLRTSLVVRALTAYAPVVGVQLAQATHAGSAAPTANFGGALILSFETDESGVFFNQSEHVATNNLSWPLDTTDPKHVATDIVDFLGKGGMTTVKTKPGLNNLLAALATVSYDGGTTTIFGAGSSSGAITLPDGQVTAGAPALSAAAAVAINASGLAVSWMAQ